MARSIPLRWFVARRPSTPSCSAGRGEFYLFTRDYTFNAPSTAAVVLGRSANGRVDWKGADGRTLQELQMDDMVISC
jgi:hypothetical protein